MRNLRKRVVISAFIISGTVHAQSWKEYTDSARLNLDQKDNGGAIEYYLKANELLKKDSAISITYAENNNAIGDLYVTTGQYGKAEPFYANALELREKMQGKQNLDYALSSHNLGRLYRMLGKYEKAETLLIEAKQIRERLLGTQNADYANSCNNLGILYVEIGEYDKAKPLYLEARSIREKVLGKEHVDYAASCNNLAILNVLTGHFPEAEQLYIEAKNIREKALGRENPVYAASCNNLAALYLDRGQYQKAEPLYLEARQIREKTLGKEHPDYASSCDNLAILYMDIGQYEKAEQLYLEARKIREKVLGKEHPDYARGCNNLGLFYRNLGQFEKSEALLSEARQIIGTLFGKEHFEYGKSCNNLGALYMDMGRFDKSGPLHEEAREIWAKVLGKDHPEYAKSCHNLGMVSRKAGDFNKAIEWLVEGKTIREKALGKENIDYAESCDILSLTYAEIGDYKKAESLQMEAKEIRGNVVGKEHPLYVESCMNLANLYVAMNKLDQANQLYDEAMTYEKVQVEKIFRFTTEPEKQSYLKNINEYKNYFLSFHSMANTHADGGSIYDLSLTYRNLILSSSQQLRQIAYSSTDTVIANRYNDWINTRSQLAFLYTKPAIERQDEVKVLEEKANSLEKELTRTLSHFHATQREVSWQSVRNGLHDGEAAIEFMDFQDYTGSKPSDNNFYIALMIRKDKPTPELIKLFERKQLDSLLNYRGTSPGQHIISYLYGSRPASSSIGPESLYNLIWAPLEKKLAGIKTIYFAPAGDLYKISFAALPISNTKVLSDKYRLIQLNTTTSMLDNATSTAIGTDRISLYGGIQYDVDSNSMKKTAMQYKNSEVAMRSLPEELLRDAVSEFYFLTQSEKEVKGIGELARQKKYSVSMTNGMNASEESVKSLSGKNSPAFIHIATHGFFFPDPKTKGKEDKTVGASVFKQSDNPLIRSGLAFAGANNAWKGKSIEGIDDGILTAYEVSNMYLPDTKLAVLSACETGLGDIQGSEGVYGLQRAFKIAGVRNLVMSLWKVDDVAASEFMQEFYKNLFARQPIQEAFNNAQSSLKNKYRNDPYRWAAWILVR